jgi:hypothetical protein
METIFENKSSLKVELPDGSTAQDLIAHLAGVTNKPELLQEGDSVYVLLMYFVCFFCKTDCS